MTASVGSAIRSVSLLSCFVDDACPANCTGRGFPVPIVVGLPPPEPVLMPLIMVRGSGVVVVIIIRLVGVVEVEIFRYGSKRQGLKEEDTGKVTLSSLRC
ncbi:hypothetical protein B0H13DRAFT_2073276 [Mycena leptocephala]|nr:hypothetical protein B0H13DRAFT_2073276 [Mycena leptocephala]